jgi:hypothetical protein
MTLLLASVRSTDEAEAALVLGAHIVDLISRTLVTPPLDFIRRSGAEIPCSAILRSSRST